MKLNMKTIIITGASRGIGLATTKKFLVRGWRVVGTYNKNKIPVNDSNLVSIQMDQGSTTSIAQAVQEIKNITLQIDAIINNAGITLDWVDPTIDLKIIRQVFEVNLFGVIDLTEALLPFLTTGSHIVNIDSLYAPPATPQVGQIRFINNTPTVT